MPRNITTTFLNALIAPVIRPALFFEITFANETVYLWTGPVGMTITWNYQDWVGLGGALTLSPIEEASTVEAKGISISLSGIDNSQISISEVLNQFQFGL